MKNPGRNATMTVAGRKRMNMLADNINRIHEKGSKAVGCFPLYPPVELVHSFGLVPLVLWDMKEAAPSLEESDRHLQTFACSVARRLAGFILSDEGARLDGILMYNACDTLRNMPEILQSGLSEKGRRLPILRMHVPMIPSGRTDAKEYLAARIDELVRGMEETFGVRFSADTFRESVRVYNEMRGLSHRLELLTAEGRMSYREFSRIIRTGHFTAVEDQVRELSSAVKRAEATPAVPNKKRIIVTGILPPPDALIDAIEGAGLRVAGNDVASQARSYGHETAETGDPAAYYNEAYRSRRACTTLLYTADRRIGELCALVGERDARGVLFAGEKFCEYEYLELPYLRKILDGKKIAHMEIEIAAGDQDSAGSVRTRVEAFAELLDT